MVERRIKIFLAITFLPAQKTHVEGLTTAAALLFSVVIGMGVALSQYIISFGATILAVGTLWSLGKIQNGISHK
jgi:uncharacterized membrane protein YhiD involved in acid resistance